MNIVLADILPPGINLSESAVDSDTEAGDFSDLIKSSLSEYSLSLSEYSLDNVQVIENKELNTVSPDLEILDEVASPESAVAYLPIADVADSTNTDPVEIAIAGTSIPIAGLELATRGDGKPVDADIALVKPTGGTLLPGDGKVLPQNGEVGSQTPMPGLRQIRQQAETPVIPSTELTGISSGSETQRSSLKRGDGGQLPQASDQSALVNSDKLAEAVPAKILDFQAGQYSQPESAINRPIAITAAVSQPGLQANTPLPTQLEPLTIARPDSPVEWSNGIGDRVSWMINQKLNTATIRLDPPSLGKLEIHIQVRDEATNITIVTQNALTRELLDSASTRLRDILQEANYQNVSVDVGHDRSQPRSGSQHSAEISTGTDDLPDGQHGINGERESESVRYFNSDSIVDIFA